MERFHSHGQHLCKGVGTKERVYIRKEFNSQDRQFPSSPSLCFKARLSATPLRWKWFFILVQINFIFTSDNKVSALGFVAYLFGKPTWSTYHCFGTPIWPLWLHVKRLYRNRDVSLGEWLPRSDFLYRVFSKRITVVLLQNEVVSLHHKVDPLQPTFWIIQLKTI